MPARPRDEHLGAVQRVAVEQIAEMADRAEAARPAGGVGRVPGAAQVRGQAVQPRLAQALADELE